jgi:uncharacterized repeat protein (TIGR03803 family)
MNPKMRARLLGRVLLSLAVVCSLVSTASAEWKEKVLYSFQGGTNDGFVPAGGVVFDKQGNLYGATTGGGPSTCAPFGSECGTVFQLSPPAQKGGSWTETLIYQFQGKGSNDGSVPNGGLIIDAAGNLYGVTAYGGTGYCLLLGSNAGCGTVYKISPPQQQGGAWTETILYSFATAKEGYLAIGNLVFDGAGNLYGATWFGGDKGTTCDSLYGGQCGVVFELSPPKQHGGKWTEKVLHSFAGGMDGAQPNGGLVLGSKGAVYGTTYEGGSGDWGTVYELKPPTRKGSVWAEKQLHVFTTGNAGGLPSAGVIFDSKANLYGTTVGTIFRLAPPSTKSGRWKETILSTFNNYEAYDPSGALIFDAGGSLYGTTQSAETSFGTVLRLRPPSRKGGAWAFSVLYGFTGSPDGAQPAAELIFDKHGNLYSTTERGGTGQSCQGGCGTVFEVSP